MAISFTPTLVDQTESMSRCQSLQVLKRNLIWEESDNIVLRGWPLTCGPADLNAHAGPQSKRMRLARYFYELEKAFGSEVVPLSHCDLHGVARL